MQCLSRQKESRSTLKSMSIAHKSLGPFRAERWKLAARFHSSRLLLPVLSGSLMPYMVVEAQIADKSQRIDLPQHADIDACSRRFRVALKCFVDSCHRLFSNYGIHFPFLPAEIHGTPHTMPNRKADGCFRPAQPSRKALQPLGSLFVLFEFPKTSYVGVGTLQILVRVYLDEFEQSSKVAETILDGCSVTAHRETESSAHVAWAILEFPFRIK